KATSEYALSILANQVLPTGVAGDGLRAWRHSRSASEKSPYVVFEAMALDRISGQLALWLVVVLTAPLTFAAGLVHASSFALGAAVVLGCALSLWLLVSWLPGWQRNRARLATFLRRSALFLFSPRGAAVHLPYSLLFVAFTLAQLYVAARAIGVELPWRELAWLGPLILVAASLPSFFGGWGIREGASALLFGAAGLPQSTGVAVSMVYGAFALVVSLPGFVVLLFDAERSPKAGNTPWGYANALSMLGGTLLALWLSYPPLLAFVAALSFFIMVAQSRGSWTPDGGFGLPNAITTVRLVLSAGLLFSHQHPWGLLLALIAVFNLLLDIVDGWLARRNNQSSKFGALFDIETDALLVLTLTVILFTRHIAGAWVLTAGLLRYLYVLAPAIVPTTRDDHPRSRHGRLVYVLMLVCYMFALIVPPSIGSQLALIGTVAVSGSFLRAFWYKYRSGPVAAV
ncbi:MAG TPA: lysylphosphatidylglycerol synthase domain-containing protein, partial [Polyangiaceae bacterium]|nr:lysylphosphatidylglycerol synthase domain-containing protein [Polyangiaceae bacterium]